MYVALTMITQNALSRKQHSSENREGWIDHSWLCLEATQAYLVPSRVSAFLRGLSASAQVYVCDTPRCGETETDREGESASTPVLMWGVSSPDKLLQLLSGSGGACRALSHL